MDILLSFSVPEIQARLRSGELSVREVTEAYLRRIEETNARTNAYLLIDREGALRQADALDARLANKEDIGILGGIPVAVKDLFCTEGIKTTAATNILKDYIPAYDATAVRKLKEAGAVILGKTNLDAFAHGSSTETSDFGPSHNPYDLDRHPGGSSGGSTSALAARAALLAIGSETGGSLRQPAALTGTVAIKPTYGRISRYGLMAMASSLDTVGPMARSVWDAAVGLQALAGFDAKDGTSAQQPFPGIEHLAKDDLNLQGVRIGVPEEGLLGRLPERLEKPLQEALKVLEARGAEIKKVSIPSARVADAVYAVLCPCEVSSNLVRYDGIHYGTSAEVEWPQEVKTLRDVYEVTRGKALGREAKRRVMLGTYALSAGYHDAYYTRAAQVRTKIRHEFVEVFKEVDLLVGAAAPDVAPKLGTAVNDPTYGYTSDDPLTYASVMAGLPALALPCGFALPTDGEKPLPVGLQIVGPQFGETEVIRAGLAFEKETAQAEWRAQLEHIVC